VDPQIMRARRSGGAEHRAGSAIAFEQQSDGFGRESTSADVAVCPANAIAAKHGTLVS
jgi:hypothetical protein